MSKRPRRKAAEPDIASSRSSHLATSAAVLSPPPRHLAAAILSPSSLPRRQFFTIVFVKTPVGAATINYLTP